MINKALNIDNIEHIEKSQSPKQVKHVSKKGPKRREFPNDKSTNQWLDAQAPSTRSHYSSYWHRVLQHWRMTGDQILENRKTDSESLWEKKTLQLKEWLKTQRNRKGELLSDYYVREAIVAVRSFFAFHHADLKFRYAERVKLKEAKPKTVDYRFTREDLKKMADVGSLEEKYVVVAGKSFGLRASDFLQLKRGHFDSIDLNSEPPISIGRIYTTKEKVPAYPFVDSDLKPIIELMLKNMERKGRIDPNEPMLRYRHKNTLTQILQRLVDKADIKYGNKVVRFHCLRKFLTDRLKDVMSESAWKQIVGKKISESAYVTEERLREDYAKARTETTFAKVATEEEIKLLALKEALKIQAKMAGYREEDLKKIFRTRKATTLQAEVHVLEELTEKKNKQTIDVQMEIVKKSLAKMNCRNC